MKLVAPHPCYESAFHIFYQDFVHHDPENSAYYEPSQHAFAQYVQRLNDEAQGIGLPTGYVPCNHFWLVDDAHQILGAIRVRHHIENDFLRVECGHIGYDVAPSQRRQGVGSHMLSLALRQAHALGIERALLVADSDNWASRGVIENNGGVFESLVWGNVFECELARYWIETSGSAPN
ncbi:GNAT family N-acetyltransferase [Vibrio furnissii]|uniref:GNAT family N-acetyltransferase n=1 Tax=Vibrio furnissii TaxID=29494 RepID=UPI003D7C63CB